jgi:hypothetical protein
MNASSNGSMHCSSDPFIITTRKGKKTTGSEQKERFALHGGANRKNSRLRPLLRTTTSHLQALGEGRRDSPTGSLLGTPAAAETTQG